jgi:hypothetical protein
MKTSKIDLDELYRIKHNREIKNINVFNHILDGCYKKIRHIAEHGGMSLYFKIPPIVLGFPLYDHKSCISYIIKQLKKSGLYASELPEPNNKIIYISWKIEDINEKAKNKLLLL